MDWHLTHLEFAEQKAKLLGKSLPSEVVPATPEETIDDDRLAATLSTSAGCKAFLISRGCSVTQSGEYVWEVFQPSGITVFARSPAVLKTIAARFASE